MVLVRQLAAGLAEGQQARNKALKADDEGFIVVMYIDLSFSV